MFQAAALSGAGAATGMVDEDASHLSRGNASEYKETGRECPSTAASGCPSRSAQ